MIHQWISGILGLVVAVIMFLNVSETTLTWTLVVAGLAIAISSFWGMVTGAEEDRSRGSRSHV